jgi:RHS repeat-associated protein
MKKISIIVLVSVIINLFSPFVIYAEQKQEHSLDVIKKKISPIAETVKMTEDDVDKYLSEYDRANDFIYELIKYKKYLESNPEKEISFDDFRNNKYDEAVEIIAYEAAQANVSDAIFMPPDNEEHDYRNYTMVNENERINYATGMLIHEETDFVLPGVNGLDFALTMRFNQDEAAVGAPYLVPVFDSEDKFLYYSTFMTGYTSEAEQRHGIGAGWSFSLPYVKQDRYDKDRYYIRLADGSTLDTDRWERKTGDIKFEARGKGDYVVTYKNGTKDYFNDKGIIKTEDRYGNSIQYFYADDGLIEKIIDSVNREITFERTYSEDNNKVDVYVCVDNEWMCEYRLEKNSYGKYIMYEKQTQNKDSLYYYRANTVEVMCPRAYNSDENTVFTMDEIVNLWGDYSYKYDYEKGSMRIEDDYNCSGDKEYMRIKNRKTVGMYNCQDEVINEVNYKYSDYDKYWHIPYEVTETIAQTGLQTTYMSDNDWGLIKNKKITAPDSNVTVEINYSYDKYNLMESYTQRTYSEQGETTVTEAYEHDRKGNVTSHTDKFGTQRKYTYDEATSVITKIEEPILFYGSQYMRYTINTLDEHGNIVTSSIASNSEDNIVRSVISTYDSYGNVLSKKTTPEYMENEYFEYTDDHANVKKYKKGDIVAAQYTYDNWGRKISETNALGQTTRYKYNMKNQVVETINPDNTNTKNLYYNDLIQIRDLRDFRNLSVYFNENGPVKKEKVDDFGRVTSISTMPILDSQNQYDNIYHYEDFKYDGYYCFHEVVYNVPWEEREQIQYDSIGRVTQVSDVNGTTKYEYDAFNRIIKQINPDLSERRIEYNDIERTRTVYDEEGNKTTEKYDVENRVIAQTIYPEADKPATHYFGYDRTGNLSSETDYNGNGTEYYYDEFGRKYTTINAEGEVSIIKYAGDLSSVTESYPDGMPRRVSNYDTFGRLSSVMDENFNVSKYAYDAAGNLIETTDKSGNAATYSYNSRGLVTEAATDYAQRTYTYTPTGNIKAVENKKENSYGKLEKENRIQYNYRVDGLVNAETAERLNGTNRVTFNTQYNKIDSSVGFTVRKDTGEQIKQIKYGRNSMDRVSNIGQTAQGVNNNSLGYEYYANGWLKKETLPNGYINNYKYDGAGRMTELNRLDANGAAVMKYNYVYDNNGNRTRVVETDKDGRRVITTYIYDKLNRLKKEVNGHSGNTTEYAFDCRNNIVSKTVSGAENYTENYLYTSEHTEGHMSNRVIVVTRKSGNDVLSRTAYYQEPNGNTYKKVVLDGESGDPTEVTDYTYNSWNLMESASVQKGNVRTDVTFSYDATDRRNGKTTKVYENDYLTDSTTTEYIWYGDKVQYEEVTHNTITDTKVNLWGASGLAARNNEIFSSDAHGNTDEAHGTTTKRYIYDAYGNQINENENDDNPYRYCGENYDEETGLYYLRARYYDPSIGRFLSEDPAQDGLNWYVYCGNNPVMRIDSTGNSWEYYDSYLTEEQRGVINTYTNYYYSAGVNDTIDVGNGVTVNAKEYWHMQAMNVRNELFDARFLLYAQKDFEYFGINEYNFRTKLGYNEDNASLKQAKYEYALGLYIATVMNPDGDQNRVRNSDGSMNKYGQTLYALAGGISKLSGKAKANDVPSWARGQRPAPGENGKSFAKRLMDQKYGAGNYDVGPGSEYNMIKKWGDRGFR